MVSRNALLIALTLKKAVPCCEQATLFSCGLMSRRPCFICCPQAGPEFIMQLLTVLDRNGEDASRADVIKYNIALPLSYLGFTCIYLRYHTTIQTIFNPCSGNNSNIISCDYNESSIPNELLTFLVTTIAYFFLDDDVYTVSCLLFVMFSCIVVEVVSDKISYIVIWPIIW